jgi:signal peptidase II
MSHPQPNALSWLGLSAVLIALDQWSKHWAVSNLVYGEPVPVIDGWAWWTLVHNYGAAFSFLANAGGWQRWFFTALAVVISTALVAWLARTPRSDWRTALPFALVVAGALGNLVDRLRFGYVVDFIDVLYWPGRHWPAFNIADSCIVVGAILLVLFSFKAPEGAKDAG